MSKKNLTVIFLAVIFLAISFLTSGKVEAEEGGETLKVFSKIYNIGKTSLGEDEGRDLKIGIHEWIEKNNAKQAKEVVFTVIGGASYDQCKEKNNLQKCQDTNIRLATERGEDGRDLLKAQFPEAEIKVGEINTESAPQVIVVVQLVAKEKVAAKSEGVKNETVKAEESIQPSNLKHSEDSTKQLTPLPLQNMRDLAILTGDFNLFKLDYQKTIDGLSEELKNQKREASGGTVFPAFVIGTFFLAFFLIFRLNGQYRACQNFIFKEEGERKKRKASKEDKKQEKNEDEDRFLILNLKYGFDKGDAIIHYRATVKVEKEKNKDENGRRKECYISPIDNDKYYSIKAMEDYITSSLWRTSKFYFKHNLNGVFTPEQNKEFETVTFPAIRELIKKKVIILEFDYEEDKRGRNKINRIPNSSSLIKLFPEMETKIIENN